VRSAQKTLVVKPERRDKFAVGVDGKIVLRWVKMKLSLYLTKHHAMKTYWGVDI
jgi:hypothetical protein